MFRHINVIYFIIFSNIISNIFANHENSNSLFEYEDIVMRRKMFAELDEMKNLLKDVNQRLESYQEVNSAYNETKELPLFDIRYDIMPNKCLANYTPKNCDEATTCLKRGGIYEIQIDLYSNEAILVECDAKTENGGWIVILRRQDGSENFIRNWSEFKEGFGSLQGEFFIGLDKLYALTHYLGQQELLVVMEAEGVQKYARYSSFVIGNETEYYSLKSVGKYSGTAGDSLKAQVGMKFTTKDRDNDVHDGNCAEQFTGAWWHKKCHVSNLMGQYGDHTFGKGINWHSFKGHNHSIAYVKMMIRRRRE